MRHRLPSCTTGRAVVGSSTRLTLTTALTIEAWIGTTAQQGQIVGATNDAWRVSVATGGFLELAMLGQTLRSTTAINDGGQHLINATWNGAIATWYVDGMLDGQLALPGVLTSSTGGLTFGARPGAGDFYAGLLDDVVVFDYALTAAQILDRFAWDNGEQSATSGVFSYTITANPSGSARSAAIGVSDQAIPVSQAGAPPVLTSASPTSGGVGTAVTISGTGFGTTQGTGSVWLGSKNGAVVSWAETQIVATVGMGAVSGNVHVRHNGTVSNTLPFAVPVSTITSVTVSSDGTQVTITGSGFGATQGTGQLWLGTAAGTVTSWNDGQIVATVAAGSSAGNVQVLQNGAWGASVPFTPANLDPHINSLSPTVGGSATVVTLYGSGFGAAQGTGAVSLGGALAPVESWSDSVVVVRVSAYAITGVVKLQQHGTWSNAMTFRVPSTGTNVTVTPNVVSLVVGDTRGVQALGAQGAPVTGLTWTSSDPAIVSLSSTDPPVLTAVAPGNVTVSGGDGSADVTVYAESIPMGSVLWSDPGNTSGVSGIYIAVPNYDAVADVFAVHNDGSVQAITSDGTVAWTASPPVGSYTNAFLPDFQGGLVVFTRQSIARLAPLTGQRTPLYAPTKAEAIAWGLDDPAIHPDGTIVTTDYACPLCRGGAPADGPLGAWVIGIHPTTGATTFRAPLANSLITRHVAETGLCGVQGVFHDDFHSYLSSPIKIAGDGYAYVSYVEYDYDVRVSRAASVQTYPDQAYDLFDRFLYDLGDPGRPFDFDAAVADLAALGDALGTPFSPTDPLSVAVQNHAPDTAYTILHARFGDTFRRPCNATSTYGNKLHLLRIGSDGASTDVVVKQWSQTGTLIYTPTSEAPRYHRTQTETGPSARIAESSIITNADQGALYSWQVAEDCSYDYETAEVSFRHIGTCAAAPEQHLTTTSGGAIVSDVVRFRCLSEETTWIQRGRTMVLCRSASPRLT